jgi:hypothetical protein
MTRIFDPVTTMALAMILARLSFAVALNSFPMMCEALAQNAPGSAAWSVPDIDTLPDDAKGQRTRLGRILRPRRPSGRRSIETFRREQSRLRRLPPPSRNQKIRFADFRAFRRFPDV